VSIPENPHWCIRLYISDLGERAVASRGVYESVRYGILNILQSLRKKFVEYKFDLVNYNKIHTSLFIIKLTGIMINNKFTAQLRYNDIENYTTKPGSNGRY
jgi:hypothetical protein